MVLAPTAEALGGLVKDEGWSAEGLEPIRAWACGRTTSTTCCRSSSGVEAPGDGTLCRDTTAEAIKAHRGRRPGGYGEMQRVTGGASVALRLSRSPCRSVRSLRRESFGKGARRSRSLWVLFLQGVERAQSGEAREVAIGRAQGGPVLDRQRGQGRIGDERARDLGAVQQVTENVPVALARIDGRNRR